MEKLPARVTRKKKIWRRYSDNLTDCVGVNLFDHDLDNASPWFIDSLTDRRDELMIHLKEKNVETRVRASSS